MTPPHFTVLVTDRGAFSVADSCHCHAHRTGWESPLSPGPSSFLMPHRRGGGGSLPQSPLLFSALNFSIPLSIFLSFYSFTGYTSPLHSLYYLYHFALSSHTQAQVLYLCTIHTSTWTLSLCTLCTTFLVDINTVTINAHCNIGPDLSCICIHPTPSEHVIPMCIVLYFDLCMFVCELSV